MKIKDKILSETSEEVKQRVRDTANKLVMKQETLEEAAEKYVEINVAKNVAKLMYKEHFVEGAKWQQENSYSEEEVLDILYRFHYDLVNSNIDTKEEWFKQFKKE